MPEDDPLETGTEMLHMKVWCNQVCPDYLIAMNISMPTLSLSQ